MSRPAASCTIASKTNRPASLCPGHRPSSPTRRARRRTRAWLGAKLRQHAQPGQPPPASRARAPRAPTRWTAGRNEEPGRGTARQSTRATAVTCDSFEGHQTDERSGPAGGSVRDDATGDALRYPPPPPCPESSRTTSVGRPAPRLGVTAGGTDGLRRRLRRRQRGFRTAQDSCAPWFSVLRPSTSDSMNWQGSAAGHRRAGSASAARAHAERQPRIGRHLIGQRVAAQRLGQLAGSRLLLRLLEQGQAGGIVMYSCGLTGAAWA